MSRYNCKLIFYFVLLLTVLKSTLVLSAIGVVSPTNGNCINVSPEPFVTLSRITIYEEFKDDFPIQTNTTLILTCPSGFEFNPGVGTFYSRTPASSGNMTSSSITVTSSTITLTFTFNSVNKWDSVYIEGIQVRALSLGVYGDILRLSGSGGTATMVGDSAGEGLSHGFLLARGGNTYTIANGVWSDPSIWSSGIAPLCNDTVTIYHTVTADMTSNHRVMIIENTGVLTTDFAIQLDSSFYINGNGYYRHNNLTNDATTIFKGTEYISSTSTIEVLRWHNLAVALPTNISGNVGNITFNQGATWGQKGLFAPAIIKGTLTVSSGIITMDEGVGITTSLTLNDVVVNNTGALRIATGPARNLNLITGNYTYTSTIATKSAMMLSSQGNFTWTANGDVYISHNWTAYQHSGANPGYTTININGDFTIAGGTFDINLAVDAPLDLTVTGNTTITGSPTRVQFIDRNSGDLNFTTNNFYIYGGASNQLMGGGNPTGDGTINVINDLILTGAGTSLLLYNSSASTGTVDLNVGRDIIISDGLFRGAISNGDLSMSATRNIIVNTSTGTFTGQNYALSTGNTELNVTGYFEINNGTGTISTGLGFVDIDIVENIAINNGRFYAINNVVATNNGAVTLNCDNINFVGGFFSLFNSSTNDSKTMEVNVNTDINVTFLNSTDRFQFVGLAGNNDALLDLNVGYNITIGGNFPGSYFLSSASSGEETIDLGGSLTVNAGDVYFVGNQSTLANSHDITTNIGGNIDINGGNTRLSTGVGTAIVNVTGGTYISGGTLSLKYSTGTSTMNIFGAYDQTNGTFNIHSGTTGITESATVNIYGQFRQIGGILSFDNSSGLTLAEHNMNIYSAVFILSGTGVIRHANDLSSNYVFGQLNFNRVGTTNYYRNSGSHQIEHVRQTISSNTTVDASSSLFRYQITSMASSLSAENLALTINGVLDMGNKTLEARQYPNFYAYLTLNNGARYRTSHTNGLYTGLVGTVGSIHGYISGLNRTDFYLDANSTVEVYGTAISQVTGVPNGIATTTNHQYGILEINFTGTAGSTWVYPETNDEVHIRTSLILTEGEFNMDIDHATATGGRAINIENGATISRTNGYIRSETEDGSGLIRWNITVNGSYVFPFGYDATTYIPFTHQQTSGSSGIVSVGTFRSLTDNTPFPPTVTHVRDVNGVDNSAQTVDRFWYIDIPGSVTSSLTFTFATLEGTGIVSPRAQLWEPVTMGWWPSAGVQSNPTANSTNASGITSLNNWWTLSAAASPLPIELLYFEALADKNQVELVWKTASELNNDYFTILKSKNGTEFTPLANINGAGNSNSPLSYSYIDNNPFAGINYYQLLQTDYDGKQAYSDVRSVYIKNENSIGLHPNPVEAGQTLNITFQNTGNFIIELYESTGKRIYKKSVEINHTLNYEINFTDNQFARGMYFLKVYNDQDQATGKIIFN